MNGRRDKRRVSIVQAKSISLSVMMEKRQECGALSLVWFGNSEMRRGMSRTKWGGGSGCRGKHLRICSDLYDHQHICLLVNSKLFAHRNRRRRWSSHTASTPLHLRKRPIRWGDQIIRRQCEIRPWGSREHHTFRVLV